MRRWALFAMFLLISNIFLNYQKGHATAISYIDDTLEEKLRETYEIIIQGDEPFSAYFTEVSGKQAQHIISVTVGSFTQ